MFWHFECITDTPTVTRSRSSRRLHRRPRRAAPNCGPTRVSCARRPRASGGGGSARGGGASAHRVVRFLHIGNHRFHILLRRRHVAGRRLRSARRVSTGACIGCGTEGSAAQRSARGGGGARLLPRPVVLYPAVPLVLLLLLPVAHCRLRGRWQLSVCGQRRTVARPCDVLRSWRVGAGAERRAGRAGAARRLARAGAPPASRRVALPSGESRGPAIGRRAGNRTSRRRRTALRLLGVRNGRCL